MIEAVLLNENNQVIRTVAVETEEDMSTYPGVYVLLSETKGLPTPGYIYDDNLKAFIQPQPYPSYILDEENFWWNPPVPYPNDGTDRYWNEETLSWD